MSTLALYGLHRYLQRDVVAAYAELLSGANTEKRSEDKLRGRDFSIRSIPLMSWPRSERPEEVLIQTQTSTITPKDSMSDNNEAPVKLSLPLVRLQYAKIMVPQR